jgi:hypothetical protein
MAWRRGLKFPFTANQPNRELIGESRFLTENRKCYYSLAIRILPWSWQYLAPAPGPGRGIAAPVLLAYPP